MGRFFVSGKLSINRGTFVGRDEFGQPTTGKVRFGRTWKAPNGGGRTTSVRVALEDGRAAFGNYTNPKSVKLEIAKE